MIGVLTGTAQEVLNDPPGFEKSSTANDKMQRAWLWSEGTKFTGTMLVFTSDSKIEIKPSKEKLHIYAKKYDSHWVNPSFFFGFKPKAAAWIRTGGHMYADGPNKTIGEDYSDVTFKFENLKVDGSEMTGICTFSISYGFKGDKKLKELKGDNVPVKFTSSNLPTKSNLPVKLATPPTQSKPWLRGLDCNDERNIGRKIPILDPLFPQELRPDEKGYRNIIKEMLARHADKSPREQHVDALNDIKRERDKLWLETGTYRQELVDADHFLVAYIGQRWTNDIILSSVTTHPVILAYEALKVPFHLVNRPVNVQKSCTAPESRPSWSAIKAGMEGSSKGYGDSIRSLSPRPK